MTSDASTGTGGLSRDELLEELQTVQLVPGEVLYLERRVDGYHYRCVESATGPGGPGREGGEDPDAWMYYAGGWPEDGLEEWDEFFQDLLDELNSMTGGYDRCRWPLSDPYRSPEIPVG